MYLTQAGDRWRQAFIPLLEGIILEQGARLNATFGMQFNIRNMLGEAWFATYTLEFAQPIMETTKDDMHDILSQGMIEGWSIPTMQKHIGTLFEQYMFGGLTGDDFSWFSERMPNHRREAIARTETMRASNAGNTALYQDWGVPQHEWIATNDARTRDAHIAAHGQRVDVGSAFLVGGEYLMYPGDPAGSPENTINCRCCTVAYNPMWELLDEEGVQRAQEIEGQWVEPGTAGEGPTEDEWLRFIREHPGTVLDTPGTTDARMQEWLDSGYPSGTTIWDKEAFAKDEIVAKLSEQTGIPYDDVNDFIAQWAVSSNDNDIRSMAMQQDVAKMLGIDLPQWQADKLADLIDDRNRQVEYIMRDRGITRSGAEEYARVNFPNYYQLMDSEKQQRLLRAMYDNTQSRLNEAGIGDTVRLRRGASVSESVVEEWARKAGVLPDDLASRNVEYRGSIMDSWSLDESTARKFANTYEDDEVAVVYEMDIPRERLIGSARTGYGCLSEYEFVHLGAFNDETARIVKVRRRW